jgi:DNA modification methylase
MAGTNPAGRSTDSNDKATRHGTQKPVEAMSRPLNNHDGDVYDPFLGSGTTMVAAHQLNRKCYGMELDPKYCQVIVDRMLKLDPSLEIKRNGKLYIKTGEKQANYA